MVNVDMNIVLLDDKDFDAKCEMCGYVFVPPERGQAIEEWEYRYCCYSCYKAVEVLDEITKIED